jgi:hypothetical protein
MACASRLKAVSRLVRRGAALRSFLGGFVTGWWLSCSLSAAPSPPRARRIQRQRRAGARWLACRRRAEALPSGSPASTHPHRSPQHRAARASARSVPPRGSFFSRRIIAPQRGESSPRLFPDFAGAQTARSRPASLCTGHWTRILARSRLFRGINGRQPWRSDRLSASRLSLVAVAPLLLAVAGCHLPAARPRVAGGGRTTTDWSRMVGATVPASIRG